MWKHFGISYGEMPNKITNNSYFNNPKLRSSMITWENKHLKVLDKLLSQEPEPAL